MLAVFAAIVPILGSLFVVASVLHEYAQRAHTVRVFDRVWARDRAENAAVAELELGVAERNRRREEIRERRMMLFRANGLDPYLGTARAATQLVIPKPLPRIELTRQWVLLSTATAGVVLVALDAASR